MSKGIVAAIASGLIAVWLFLSLSETQMADREVQDAHFARDIAEFDRDFQMIRDGAVSPELESRAKEANVRLERLAAERDATASRERDKRGTLQGAVEDEINQQTGGAVDLRAAGQKLVGE